VHKFVGDMVVFLKFVLRYHEEGFIPMIKFELEKISTMSNVLKIISISIQNSISLENICSPVFDL
jgi:hypothetical protein